MGLFQKKPLIQSSAPLYTLSANKTLLLLGLGNPGSEYKFSRHNLGFMVLDKFAISNSFSDWITKKDLKCQVSWATLGHNRVILCKPNTFMNDSGQAAQAVQHFYRIYNPDTVAIYDELALEFGQLRTRSGGTDAGHNGVKSLIQHIGNDFGRLRIGISTSALQQIDPSKFVLGKFTQSEQPVLDLIVSEAGTILNEYVFSGQLPPDTRHVL